MDGISEILYRLSIGFVPFMMAVVFHEYAHGFAATRWGDDTARQMGRLTLNPLPHLDLLGTVIFPILMLVMPGGAVLFGWAKPVPIDPRRFRKFRPALFWVSFAGPLMNLLLGLVAAFLFAAVMRFLPRELAVTEPLTDMLQFTVMINAALAFFNLVPLPPLDGSKIVEAFLPYDLAVKFESITRYSFFILLALMFTGAFRVLMIPIEAYSRLVLTVAAWAFGFSGVSS